MTEQQTCFIHESSYVDDGAEIGPGTRIWHLCHILSGAVIGPNCRIGQNVVIGPDVRIGSNVKIQNNVSVYPGVTLEDDVFCGPSVVFTNVDTPHSAHPRNTAEDFFPTLVKRGASIGANTTIVCGKTIGVYALIGAGSVVTKDVSPYALVYGNPARQRGWACECGVVLKFRGHRAVCRRCDREYRETAQGVIERYVVSRIQYAA